MIVTPEDELHLQGRGITLTDLIGQIDLFTKDIQPVKLEKPCVVSDGILQLNGAECNRLAAFYDEQKQGLQILGFVPASGAASRMFKHLHHYLPDNENDLTEEFILHFNRFPFLGALAERMEHDGQSLEMAMAENNWSKIFDYILTESGLNYDDQLKGMVLFHKYGDNARTAFEEHLHEFLKYGRQSDTKCKLHFTLASQHISLVSAFMNERVKEFQYEDIEITYSVQSPNTDTIALTKENNPVRDASGQLVFRPGGHGALIHNLQSLNADILFIKNIDNVTTETQVADTVFYKKVLAGLLIEVRKQIHHYLNELDNGNVAILDDVLEFIHERFQPGLPLGHTQEQLIQYAKLRLDRPLRICGMVRNEGEPGGGPFWVKMPGGYLSKQIVEKSQLETDNVQQSKIFKTATHFNPVDIVCGIKKRNGENYALENFIDHTTGFVSEKFQHGHVIKALELPGLWNGAMALWNTIFVEVPISTFNPVKTVNDLLRPGHQS